MANVIFYEKPGCINNTRQKNLLQRSGHSVTAHNLLYAPWTSNRLLAFFQDLPVADWFNRSAPLVKEGKLDPDKMSRDEALYHMVHNPILIRRPLMEVAGTKLVGFDAEYVDALIGLVAEEDLEELTVELESCPRQ